MLIKVLDGKIQLHEAKYNLCDPKPKPELIQFLMAGWAIPDRCPIKRSFKFCYNPSKVIKLSPVSQKVLSLFILTPKVTVRIIITHDTGTTCFEGLNRFLKIN